MKKTILVATVMMTLSFACYGLAEQTSPIKDQKEVFVHSTNFP